MHGMVSSYLGVYWDKQKRKWHAVSPCDEQGKLHFLGLFTEQEDAARITLLCFKQALLAMPAHVKATHIWRRNYDKVRMQTQELELALLVA